MKKEEKQCQIAMRFNLPVNIDIKKEENFTILLKAVMNEGFTVDFYAKSKNNYGCIVSKGQHQLYISACHGNSPHIALMAALEKNVIGKGI